MSELSIEDQRKILEAIASGDLTLEDLHNGNDLRYLEAINAKSVIVSMDFGTGVHEYYHNGCKVTPDDFAILRKGLSAKQISLNLNVSK